MANALYEDYRERGVEIVHVIIDDGTGDGKVDGDDAHLWAYGTDHDGNGEADTLLVTVIADTDRWLWENYIEDCGGNPFCAFSCHVTPQHQIIDRGRVTVVDKCSVPEGQSTCEECGYNDAAVRAQLDSVLPDRWCGEALP